MDIADKFDYLLQQKLKVGLSRFELTDEMATKFPSIMIQKRSPEDTVYFNKDSNDEDRSYSPVIWPCWYVPIRLVDAVEEKLQSSFALSCRPKHNLFFPPIRRHRPIEEGKIPHVASDVICSKSIRPDQIDV